MLPGPAGETRIYSTKVQGMETQKYLFLLKNTARAVDFQVNKFEPQKKEKKRPDTFHLKSWWLDEGMKGSLFHGV